MRRSTSSKRRAAQQCTRIGVEIRLARLTSGWTHQDVARRAGVAWDTAVRVEHGEPSVGLDTVCAVAEAVGLDLVVRTYPGRQPSLRDTGQLEHAERLRSRAHASWQVRTEVSAGPDGEAIDLVFFGPQEILDIEIERMATDFQAQYRRANRKREALASHHGRPVRLILAIEDTHRNRLAIEPHLPFIQATFPARSREVLGVIRGGHPLQRDGLLWVRRRSSGARPVDPRA